MSTIIEKLQEILTIKNEIKGAIRDKGGKIEDGTPFSNYPNCIRNIETGSGGGGDPIYEIVYNTKTENGMNFDGLFRDYKGVELDVSSLKTSRAENMSNMFSGCEFLQSLDVSNFNTSRVRNMRDMFCACRDLQSLDLSNFNTSNVEEMSNMFSGCEFLQSLDVSNFNISRVWNMSGMFRECRNLQSLDLSNFNTSNVEEMNDMFSGCDNLRELYLRHCENDTISKIINSNEFPTGKVWDKDAEKEIIRKIYCDSKYVEGLEAPDGWEFITE